MKRYRYPDPFDRIPARSVSVRTGVSDETLLENVLDALPIVPGKIVDLGAGTGRLTGLLSRSGAKVCAVEPDADRAMHIDIRPEGSVTVERANIGQFAPNHTGEFDFALCAHVIQHVSPDARSGLLAACAKVVRPGGFLLVLYTASLGNWSRYMLSANMAETNSIVTRLVTREEFKAETKTNTVLPVWHAGEGEVRRYLQPYVTRVRTDRSHRSFVFEITVNGHRTFETGLDSYILAEV